MPRYELDDKFWQIDLKGKAFTTTAGKIGKAGHTKIKELSSNAEAKAASEAAIAAKVKEGYALAGKPAKAKAARPAKPAKPTKAAKTANTDALAKAIESIKKWMSKNGAEVLVKNLAKGANDGAIKKAEKALGFPLPPELAALWRIHDGQKEELNGFIGSLDLLGSKHAPTIREFDLMPTLDWMLGEEDMADEAELKPVEADKRWIPFGLRDADELVVHAETGRVFRVAKDSPPFSLEAKSLTAFFERYAKAVERGEYRVEEGFGDAYLAAGR